MSLWTGHSHHHKHAAEAYDTESIESLKADLPGLTGRDRQTHKKILVGVILDTLLHDKKADLADIRMARRFAQTEARSLARTRPADRRSKLLRFRKATQRRIKTVEKRIALLKGVKVLTPQIVRRLGADTPRLGSVSNRNPGDAAHSRDLLKWDYVQLRFLASKRFQKQKLKADIEGSKNRLKALKAEIDFFTQCLEAGTGRRPKEVVLAEA